MTRFVRISLFVAVSAALALPMASAASAQQSPTPAQMRHIRANAMMQGGHGAIAGFPDQTSARAAHPITQGGTTGGTVNPAINGDGQQHGYNG